MLLAQLTPEIWSLGIFLLLLNIPFFIYGYKKQGIIFTGYSLFAVTVYAAPFMIYNVLLYIIAGCVMHSFILPLYSILTYAAAIKSIDFIVEGFDKAKSAMIITTKEEEISEALSEVSDVMGSSLKDRNVV